MLLSYIHVSLPYSLSKSSKKYISSDQDLKRILLWYHYLLLVHGTPRRTVSGLPAPGDLTEEMKALSPVLSPNDILKLHGRAAITLRKGSKASCKTQILSSNALSSV